jgi:hypothetical protein
VHGQSRDVRSRQIRPVIALRAYSSAEVRSEAKKLARGLAKALATRPAREALASNIRAEGVTDEYKVPVWTFFSSESRNALTAAMASALGDRQESVVRLASDLPAMELYMPVRAHRQTWTGEPVLVAVQMEEKEAPTAYNEKGDSVVLSLTAPPSVPTFVIVPAEANYSLSGPASAAHVSRSRTKVNCGEGSLLCAASPPPQASGVVQGHAATRSIGPEDPEGLYMTYSNVSDLKEPWTKGDPEIEAHVFAHVSGAPAGSLSDVSSVCSGQESAGLKYFDQNDHTWSGEVLVISNADMESLGTMPGDTTRGFQVVLEENDDVYCETRSDSTNVAQALAIGGAGTAVSVVAYRGIWAATHCETCTGSGGLYLAAALATYFAIDGITNAIVGNDDIIGVTRKCDASPSVGCTILQTNAALVDGGSTSGPTFSKNGGVNIRTNPLPPVPPLPSEYASFTGPWALDMEQEGTWSAAITGGHPPYLYHWSGLVSGNTSSVSDYLSEDGWVVVEVIDAEGHSWSWNTFVDVDTCGGPCTRKARPLGRGSAPTLQGPSNPGLKRVPTAASGLIEGGRVP